MSTQVHLGEQAEQHNFRPSAELPLSGRQITRHPVRNPRPSDDFQTPMAFQFGMNNSTYMLRSCVVRMPISAKFTTFSQKPMSRRQVARIALRNRPVKAFRQIKSYVNGLISTRLPEELEWVEEHIEDDAHYGMDFPNDGECLPCCCSREYSTGSIRTRSLVSTGRAIVLGGAVGVDPGTGGLKVKNVVNATPSVNGVGIDIEATSNYNYLQRAHQFRDGFNLATQTWSGDLEFPVGPFQPYKSAKSLGNTIIPYVGEASLELLESGRLQNQRGSGICYIEQRKYEFLV